MGLSIHSFAIFFKRSTLQAMASVATVASMGTVAIAATLTLALLAGCEDAPNLAPEAPKVEVLSDRIIIDSSLILTSNPERYQPSYNLYGSLLPLEQRHIRSPYAGHHPELLVQVGDWVSQGQPLVRLHTNINLQDVDLQNVDGQQADAAASSVVDIVAEAVTTLIQLPEAAETTTASVTPPVIPAATPAEDSLAATTVILTSPMEGEVTDISLAASAATKLPTANPTTSKPVTSKPVTSQPANPQLDTAAVANPETGDSNTHSSTESQHAQSQHTIAAHTPLLTLTDTRNLQLIGRLPLATQSQLTIGQAVKFTIYAVHDEFAGQISQINPEPAQNVVNVQALVLPNADSKAILTPGMQALMTIDYGQMELGVRVPRQAIHEANLAPLNKTQTRPVSPIHGYVWIIEQNQHLAYTPVDIVAYFPDSDQFLLHGIHNDSLVCLVDLPKSVDGMPIMVR